MSMMDLFQKLEFRRAPSGPVEWVVAGLGNPGAKYARTRHNTGFVALSLLAGKYGARVDRLRFRALTGEASVAGARALLLAPQTFMNLSGESVREALGFYKIPPERLIVLYDDVSLAPGRLRVRKKGSDGGHNGVKNIIYQLGTDEFPRVKIGVGMPPRPDYDMADWVLSAFDEAERKLVAESCARAVLAVEDIISNGPDWAANRHNGA